MAWLCKSHCPWKPTLQAVWSLGQDRPLGRSLLEFAWLNACASLLWLTFQPSFRHRSWLVPVPDQSVSRASSRVLLGTVMWAEAHLYLVASFALAQQLVEDLWCALLQLSLRHSFAKSTAAEFLSLELCLTQSPASASYVLGRAMLQMRQNSSYLASVLRYF